MSVERKCVVPGCCMILSSTILKWFPFPDQNSLISLFKDGRTVYYSKRRLWTESLGLTDKRIEKDAVICPLHFKEQDFTVAEFGQVILKDDVVPCLDVYDKGLDVSRRQEQKQKENDIETVEKSDDEEDDDIEIIEPHREIITLDDDDDECQKGAKSNLVTSEDFSVKPVAEQKRKDNEQNTSTSIQEKESNVHLTCMSPEAITHSIKDIIKTQPNVAKLGVTSPTTKRTILSNENMVRNNPIQDFPTAKSTLLKEAESRKLKVQCISSDGSKLFVHIPKPGSSQTIPGPGPKAPEGSSLKFLNAPGVKRIKILKDGTENAKVEAKDLVCQNLPKVQVSESMKKQISILLNKNPISSPTEKIKEVKDNQIAKASPTQNKLRKILNFPKGPTLSKKKLLDSVKNFNLFKIANEKVSVPLKEQSPKVNKGQVPKKKNTILQGSNQRSSFKYVNVDEILKNNIEHEPSELPEKDDALKATQDKGTQTDMPVGFSDIYYFIKKKMIDFTFDVFGRKYKLKECGLHFEHSSSGKKWDKAVAFVSNTTLSSPDALLLSGMNISVGYSKNNQSLDLNGFRKELGDKNETLSKYSEGKKSNVKCIMLNPPVESTNDTDNTVETKIEILNAQYTSKNYTNRNLTSLETNKKLIICPRLVKLDDVNVKSDNDTAKVGIGSKLKKVNLNIGNESIKEELSREQRKIIRKKKTQIKAALARKKVLRLPVSQMNPTFRGRLTIDRNRFKKTKKPVQENDKKRKRPAHEDSKQPKKVESKASTSIGNDSLWENVEQDDSKEDRSPIKTRSSRRGKKKDYRSFSTNGTTENTKLPTKRKKPLDKDNGRKKAKYSEKVGVIESFLEVVLEPENTEFVHNSSGTEKEISEGNKNKP